MKNLEPTTTTIEPITVELDLREITGGYGWSDLKDDAKSLVLGDEPVPGASGGGKGGRGGGGRSGVAHRPDRSQRRTRVRLTA